jgi:hypothetical protein
MRLWLLLLGWRGVWQLLRIVKAIMRCAPPWKAWEVKRAQTARLLEVYKERQAAYENDPVLQQWVDSKYFELKKQSLAAEIACLDQRIHHEWCTDHSS